MKKESLIRISLAFVGLCLGLAFVFGWVSPVEGASIAAFIPLLPMGGISGLRRPQINRAIALGDGTWGPGGELLNYPIYDRFAITNTITENILFKAAVGETRNGTVLNLADTNITKSEGVPKSQKWTIWTVQMSYLAIAARTDALIQNILSMFQETICQFKIESKDEMFTLPLWKFFGGFQLISAPAVTVNSRFPQPVFSGRWEMKIPIVLENLTSFEMVFTHLTAPNAAINGDFLCVELDGERARR